MILGLAFVGLMATIPQVHAYTNSIYTSTYGTACTSQQACTPTTGINTHVGDLIIVAVACTPAGTAVNFVTDGSGDVIAEAVYGFSAPALTITSPNAIIPGNVLTILYASSAKSTTSGAFTFTLSQTAAQCSYVIVDVNVAGTALADSYSVYYCTQTGGAFLQNTCATVATNYVPYSATVASKTFSQPANTYFFAVTSMVGGSGSGCQYFPSFSSSTPPLIYENAGCGTSLVKAFDTFQSAAYANPFDMVVTSDGTFNFATTMDYVVLAFNTTGNGAVCSNGTYWNGVVCTSGTYYNVGCSIDAGSEWVLSSSHTYFYYGQNNQYNPQIFNMTTILTDPDSEAVNFGVYVSTTTATISASNPLVLIYSYNYTIPPGSTRLKVTWNPNVNIKQNAWVAISIGVPSGTGNLGIEKALNCGDMSVLASSDNPLKMTTAGSDAGFEGFYFAQVAYLSMITMTQTQTVTISTGGGMATATYTVTNVVVFSSIDANAAITTTTGFILVFLVVILPALVMGMIGVATHSPPLTGGLFIAGLVIGTGIGNVAGIVPFWLVIVMVLVVVFSSLILLLTILKSGGGGV